MLIFLSVLMVALLVWMIVCDIRQGRDTKAKLDELEKIVKEIEEKMREE